MKRTISTFLLAVVLLGLLPIPVEAATTVVTTSAGSQAWLIETTFPCYYGNGIAFSGDYTYDHPQEGYWYIYQEGGGIVAVPIAKGQLAPTKDAQDAGKATDWNREVGTVAFDEQDYYKAAVAIEDLTRGLYEVYTSLHPEYLDLSPYEAFTQRSSWPISIAITYRSDINTPSLGAKPLSGFIWTTVDFSVILDKCLADGTLELFGRAQGEYFSPATVVSEGDPLTKKLKAVWPWHVGFAEDFPATSADADVWQGLLETEEERTRKTLLMAEASLGEYPENASFFSRALWSARAFLIETAGGSTPNLSGYVTEADVADAELSEFGTTSRAQKQAYLLSLFNLHSGVPTFPANTLARFAASEFPADVTTAIYALRMYSSLHQSGALDNEYQRMAAWTYKLQATMGLASGVLAVNSFDDSGTALTSQELNTFLDVAYGSSLSSAKSRMFGDVSYPDSAHLGSEPLARYYYYLVLCYQEFGTYATALINSIGPAIVKGENTFSGHKEDIKALKSIYDGLSWADDKALWDHWDTVQKDAEGNTDYRSLKSVYDYLLSVNAFDAVAGYDMESEDSNFRYFFGESESSRFQLSEYMREGISASASFLPMRTNTYDPYTYSTIANPAWLLNFHAKFGYNRKALYIDTNVDAAVNFQRTGTRGELRVCTLEDLLYADKDIVLYLDDNLYNVNVLAELTDKAFMRLDNVDDAMSKQERWQKVGDAIVGMWDVSMENIAKTAEVTTYSQNVFSKYRREGSNEDGKWHTYFLGSDESLEYLKPDDLWDVSKGQLFVDDSEDPEEAAKHTASTYTPITAFAVISSIYTEKGGLFSSLNTVLNRNTPVFISSPNLPYVEGVSLAELNTIYNYLLLKNLDSQMSVDYATNLDMTSPIYMDIYGNIVTESGLVVVPAAANATLWTGSYLPYNSSLFSTYGDDFLLEYTEDASALNDVLSKILTPVDGYWQLTSAKVNGGTIDLSRLSTADSDSLEAIREVFEYDLSTGVIYQQAFWQMLITEVLRGAPIEHIDKDFEGLNLSHRVTKNGLVVAEKLEFLVEALSSKGTNTTLSIPNPAYMDGIEYIVFFAFKILILAILVIWMITIYVDAVGGGVNFKTGAKCIGAVALVLSLIVGVPAAFEISYYQSNKLLLQDETEYLMMLNLEKRESGQEIGITSIHEPDTNTTLYLKLADVELPWYDLLPRIITSSSVSNLEALYEEYEGQHPIAGAKDVTVINDAVYVSTDQLFSSSSISFSPTIKTLYQQTTGDTPASYYTPYYYFLEQIINKANYYASDNNYYAYSTKVQRGGKLKTLGYVQSYFTSEYFMQEGMDYFGLYTLYDVTAPRQYPDEKFYGDTTLAATRASQWCNTNISENARIARIEKLNDFTREWVAEHRELLGKITDETFLKCMALACAMEHNRLFNTMRADNLEIYELSNEDLMRLSIADHNTVMKSSTMSYARFVFTVGGTPAVYAAALLTLVNFISSWVKPIATLLVFCITCISIFVFKLILRKSNNSIYGYICTILLMCGVNVLGSVFLKLSMYIPSTGMSPTVCILIQILVQCAYIFLLLWIIKTALKDWRNVGFERYNSGFNKLTTHQQHSVEVDTPKQKNGWDYYTALVERQRRRHRSL